MANINTSIEDCAYLRKSRKDLEAEARGEEDTLIRHEKIILELAKLQKLNLTKIYREGIMSGETIASRPDMQQLLADVEQGIWRSVLVVEIERLARGDTVDQGIVAQTFKYSNTKIVTPLKTYDPSNEFDEEFFEFGLFMSRREYKTINRRLQGGRLASVKEGKYVGNKPPYGYIRRKLEKEKGYTLEPHPEQADVVKMIFEFYTKGELQPGGTYKRLGVSLIVRKLNELRIPTVKSDAWVMSTVQGILQNPVYVGKIRWNWRPNIKKMQDGQMIKERPRAKTEDWIVVDGLHEAIIDTETWELAQELYGKNKPNPVPRSKSVKNPLSGLIVCGVCGRKMVRRPYGNKYPDTIMCPVTSCNNISSQLSYVEKKLLESLEQWVNNYKIQLGIDKKQYQSGIQIEVMTKAIKSLDDELLSLNKQMDSIHDLLEQGVYTTEKFLERSKIIGEKIATARHDRETILESLEMEHQKEEAKEIIIPKVERILELYYSKDDPAFKNSLLKEVVDKVVYRKTTNGRWHGRPDDFELILFPNLRGE